MLRGVRTKGWLVGMVALGAILEAGSAAEAGILVSGGGLRKFGDPYYFYIVKVSLEPSFQFLTGDSFTLLRLSGVTPSSTTGQPSGNPGDPSGPWSPVIGNTGTGPIPNYSPPTNRPFADVTWKLTGPPIDNSGGVSDRFMGVFKALTAVSLPLLPDSYQVTINWTANLHDKDGNAVTDRGVVVLGIIVPEPSSILMMGAGLALPCGCWLRQRQRQRRRRSQAA